MASTRQCTLVLLRLVFIGSEDLDGGETPDAILTAQGLVLVCVDGADLDDALKGVGEKRKDRRVSITAARERITSVCGHWWRHSVSLRSREG